MPGRILGLCSTLLKLSVVLPVLYYLDPIGELLALTGLPLPKQGGILHAVSNCLIAMLGMGVSPFLAPWLSRQFQEEKIRTDISSLDYSVLHKPLQAAACASGELFRMAQAVQHMHQEAWRAFDIGSAPLAKQVVAQDDQIDQMEESITSYLGRIPTTSMSLSEQNLVFGLTNFAVQLEGVVDIISRQICQFIIKNEKKRIRLSPENAEQLMRVRVMVSKRLESASSVLVSRDQAVASDFLAQGQDIKLQITNTLKNQYSQWQEGHDHFSATIYVDILHALRRISSLLNTIGHTFSTSRLEEADNNAREQNG